MIIEKKTATTTTQYQKHISREVFRPICWAKTIAMRKRTRPIQDMAKKINLKYSPIKFVCL
jgi:hypothetical protein